MNRTICNKEYDTSCATIVFKFTYSYYGSEDGYEETIYANPQGFMFLYTFGGPASPYPVEKIRRISKKRAEAFIAAHQ